MDRHGLFTQPSNPFEMEHNQNVIQERIANGRLFAFQDGCGHVVYATPDKVLPLLADGWQQMTLDEVKARHRRLMARWQHG